MQGLELQFRSIVHLLRLLCSFDNRWQLNWRNFSQVLEHERPRRWNQARRLGNQLTGRCQRKRKVLGLWLHWQRPRRGWRRRWWRRWHRCRNWRLLPRLLLRASANSRRRLHKLIISTRISLRRRSHRRSRLRMQIADRSIGRSRQRSMLDNLRFSTRRAAGRVKRKPRASRRHIRFPRGCVAIFLRFPGRRLR